MLARNTSLSHACLSCLLVACTPVRPPPASASTPPAPLTTPPAAPDASAATTPQSPPTDASAASLPWPADVPPLPEARVLEHARISWSVGDSPPGATFIAARGELHPTYRAWLDAARARGFRVLAEHRTEHVRAASLIDAGDRRASLLLQDDGDGELAGAFNFGRHPQTPLRGPCVAIPSRAQEFVVDRRGIAQGGEARAERVRAHIEARLGQDLDGDGELDILVPGGKSATCPRDVTWTVYLSRGACGHAVGVVGPGEIDLFDDAPPPGPRPLVFRSQSAELADEGLMATTLISTYTFRNGRYVRTGRTRERWNCHHCPLETCTP